MPGAQSLEPVDDLLLLQGLALLVESAETQVVMYKAFHWSMDSVLIYFGFFLDFDVTTIVICRDPCRDALDVLEIAIVGRAISFQHLPFREGGLSCLVGADDHLLEYLKLPGHFFELDYFGATKALLVGRLGLGRWLNIQESRLAPRRRRRTGRIGDQGYLDLPRLLDLLRGAHLHLFLHIGVVEPRGLSCESAPASSR